MGKDKTRRLREVGGQSLAARKKAPTASSSTPKRARSPKPLDEDDSPRKKLHTADEDEPSTSVPASHTSPKAQSAFPPPTSSVDLTPLLQKFTGAHHVTPMSILSSASIEKKVTRALELLSKHPAPAGDLPSVVLLYAKATVASKLITIVEIVKREIGQKEGNWYQYTIVNSSLEEKRDRDAGTSRKGKENADGDASLEGDASDDEESFEVMKTTFERAIEGKPKVRAVPVMAVVLSRVRIDSLRGVHGEQTNCLPAP